MWDTIMATAMEVDTKDTKDTKDIVVEATVTNPISPTRDTSLTSPTKDTSLTKVTGLTRDTWCYLSTQDRVR